MRRRSRPTLTVGRWIHWLTVLAALLILPLLWLQYRWTGELAQADRARRAAILEQQSAAFTREFDQTWGRLSVSVLFGPAWFDDGPQDLARRSEQHRALSSDGKYIKALWWADWKDGQPRLNALDKQGRPVPVAAWPSRLEPVRESARANWRGVRVGPFALFPDAMVVVGLRGRPGGGGPPGPLGMAFPGREGEPPGRRGVRFSRSGPPHRERPLEGNRPGERPPGPQPGEAAGFAMLELDLEHMKAELFPEILAHAFEAEASHHRVQVVNSRLETVWDSRPGGPEFEADSVRPFFATRPPFAGSGPRLEPGITWHLRSSVTGGIDAAVARAQARNLFAGGGVVLLLAGTVALLLSSVRRAQKLTEREFEFVAQATHELRTPISVIRAAADNLADGVVREEAQVRRYGALVRDEGRRLSRLIEQVLQYGRVTRQPGMRPVALGELVAQALADREAAGGAASRMTVEVDVAPDLPSVVGDPEAIQLILRNLIENAAVHAASGEWMRIDARANGRWIDTRVLDRGSVIDASEVEKIFDPFYRGAGSRAEGRTGSGLGLALARRLAEAQGGALDWEPGGTGNAFRLRLPKAA